MFTVNNSCAAFSPRRSSWSSSRIILKDYARVTLQYAMLIISTKWEKVKREKDTEGGIR